MHAAIFGVREAPDDLVNQYRPDLHVSPQSSPAFIWHTATDPIVPARNALLFASALAAHNVPYELHIWDSGPHGLALANPVTAVDASLNAPHAQIWVDLALSWLDRQAAPPKPTLEELLAAVTDENRHPETDFGSSVGKEEW